MSLCIILCTHIEAHFLQYYVTTYVTGFAKTCIVHTSTFSTLGSHKFYQELQIVMKFSGIVELLFLYHS